MWKSFQEYMRAVVHEWLSTIIVGGVGGLVGWVYNLFSPKHTPWWGWALIALLAIAVAQFRAFHKLRIERDNYRPNQPKRDWPILDAVHYMRDGSKWGEQLGSIQALLGAFAEIRQAAADGEIYVWGRQVRPDPNAVVILIPKEYWIGYQLDSIRCLETSGESWGCTTEPAVHQAMPIVYGQLGVNREQIQGKWKQSSIWRRMRSAIDHKTGGSSRL